MDYDGKDMNLGAWLGTQRLLKRKGQLSSEKLEKLQVGVVFYVLFVRVDCVLCIYLQYS